MLLTCLANTCSQKNMKLITSDQMMVKFVVVQLQLCVDRSDITGHEAGDICGFQYLHWGRNYFDWFAMLKSHRVSYVPTCITAITSNPIVLVYHFYRNEPALKLSWRNLSSFIQSHLYISSYCFNNNKKEATAPGLSIARNEVLFDKLHI